MIAYKYRSGRGIMDGEGHSIFERDMQLLAQNKIFVPTGAQLNDPFETIVDDSIFMTVIKSLEMMFSFNAKSFTTIYDKIRRAMKHKRGIYSLSKSIDNELMWAYYASGHTGYAIIFDTDVINQSMNFNKYSPCLFEYDIRYSDNLPKIDSSLFCDKSKYYIELIKVLTGYKSKAWEHEQEYRLLFNDGNRPVEIDYRAIKGFVFGCLMPENDIDYIMNLFQGRGLSYYQMEMDCHSYSLTYNEILDHYCDAKPYICNNVAYNIQKLVIPEIYDFDVSPYLSRINEVLSIVSKEPFVQSIFSTYIEGDKILVHTFIQQDGVVSPKKTFTFPLS